MCYCVHHLKVKKKKNMRVLKWYLELKTLLGALRSQTIATTFYILIETLEKKTPEISA